jgi:dihydrofolate reductase
MLVSLIVAMDEKGAIGYLGGLPWRLSTDLRRFKQITMGHHILMGRITYQSIGRPLPGRKTIVITRNPHFEASGVLAAASLQEALDIAERGGEEEAFVIGGGEIFAEALMRADRIYLTRVHATTEADTYFPYIKMEDWRVEESSFHEGDENNDFPSTFMLLSRRKTGG